MRASTPEEFTLEKRQQARDSLMEYARLVQGPPLPPEAQPMHMHSGADPEDFAADDGRETSEEAAAQDPSDKAEGSAAAATEAELVSTPCPSNLAV